MMNKIKTARVHIVKFLFVLPLIAVLLIAFRKKELPLNEDISQLRNIPKTVVVSLPTVANYSDTTPKAKADKTQMIERVSDDFEITDKKAVIHLRNGKKEEYDLTDSEQRKNFEANYGKIISVAANTNDLAPVSVDAVSSETVIVSQPVIATTIKAPVSVTTNSIATTTEDGETVVMAKTATTVKASASAVVTTPVKVVALANDSGYAIIRDKKILATITKNTTAQQLDDFKKQLKDAGYDLNFDKPTYNTKGTLTHISGSIKSGNEQNAHFSATDFEKLILTEVKENYRTYLRIEVVDKKKVII